MKLVSLLTNFPVRISEVGYCASFFPLAFGEVIFLTHIFSA